MDSIFGPIIGIVGVIVGALMQHLFTRRINNENRRSTSTAEAYAAYLNAVSKIVLAMEREDQTAVHDALREVTAAKAIIVVYGSSEVIQALASFDRTGGAIGTAQQSKAFAEVVLAMRKHAGSQKRVPENDVNILLFGPTNGHI